MYAAEVIILGLCGQSAFLSVPRFHRPEETLHATALFMEPGGKGYNQAVAAARLGARVAFAAAVGEDAGADACETRLLAEGIERCAFFRKPGESTAFAAILTDTTGENRVTVYPGASRLLAARDVRTLEKWFEYARLLLLTPEIPEEAFAEAASLARAHGVQLIINPAPYTPWVRAYLPQAWCITPNRSEARAMLGAAEDEMLETALRDFPCRRAVVTLGADGALLMEEGQATYVPAPIAQVVDTTGAGDALNGALCAALLKGRTLHDAARFAVRAASISVMRAHVLETLPHCLEE